MKNEIQAYSISLLSLLLMAGFASFGAVLPTPALPAIAHYFSITSSSVEGIMVIYLIGYGVGQLLYGPIANRFGRKQSVMVGIILASIGSLLAIIASLFHYFLLLMIARFLTALGAAAGLVVSMILIKDIHDELNARKTFAKIVLMFGFMPFIATALAGNLIHYLNWQVINWIMLIYSAVLLLITLKLTETLPVTKRIMISAPLLLKSYSQLLRPSNYLRLALLFTLGGATSYVFNSLAPLLIVKHMQVSTELYGWLSIAPALGMVSGGWLSARFVKQFTASQMIFCGISLMISSTVTLVLLFSLHGINLINFYILSAILFCGAALIIPNAAMQALTHTSDHANGTSVMNAIALLGSSIYVHVTSGFIGYSLLAFPMALLSIGILMALLTIKLTLFTKLIPHQSGVK